MLNALRSLINNKTAPPPENICLIKGFSNYGTITSGLPPSEPSKNASQVNNDELQKINLVEEDFNLKALQSDKFVLEDLELRFVKVIKQLSETNLVDKNDLSPIKDNINKLYSKEAKKKIAYYLITLHEIKFGLVQEIFIDLLIKLDIDINLILTQRLILFNDISEILPICNELKSKANIEEIINGFIKAIISPNSFKSIESLDESVNIPQFIVFLQTQISTLKRTNEELIIASQENQKRLEQNETQIIQLIQSNNFLQTSNHAFTEQAKENKRIINGLNKRNKKLKAKELLVNQKLKKISENHNRVLLQNSKLQNEWECLSKQNIALTNKSEKISSKFDELKKECYSLRNKEAFLISHIEELLLRMEQLTTENREYERNSKKTQSYNYRFLLKAITILEIPLIVVLVWYSVSPNLQIDNKIIQSCVCIPPVFGALLISTLTVTDKTR